MSQEVIHTQAELDACEIGTAILLNLPGRTWPMLWQCVPLRNGNKGWATVGRAKACTSTNLVFMMMSAEADVKFEILKRGELLE